MSAPASIQPAVDPATGWTVWGQRPAVADLRNAVQHGPGHAYIFSGPRQSGRRLAALEFARALCCPNVTTNGVPCRSCGVCGRVGRGVFPDVTLFDLQTQAARDKDKSKNLTLTIATVREVSAAVAYRPSEAGWRIVIVDDVEAMQETAQEAFLKTLEEPPPYAVLILLTTEADALLPTILSRGRVVRFGYSSSADIQAALEAAGEAADRAARIAGAAQGSIGWAFDAANDGALIDAREAAAQEALSFVLGASYERMVGSVVLADEFSRSRDAVFDRLHLFQAIWRSALYVAQGIESPSGITFPIPLPEPLARQSMDDLVRAIRSVDTCLANLEANVRPRLALESMVMAWPSLSR